MMDTRYETPVLEDIRLQIVVAKAHFRPADQVELSRDAYEALRLELIQAETRPWESGLEGVYVLGLRVVRDMGPGSIAFVS